MTRCPECGLALSSYHAHRCLGPRRQIYLAGPIDGVTDQEARAWRTEARTLLNGDVLDPMARDFRGREHECMNEIVEADKADIDKAALVLAHCWKPSVGTSMEIVYAWTLGKRVHVIVPRGAPCSPWLRYHATAVHDSLVAACEIINSPLEETTEWQSES